MRGKIADMDAVAALCDARGVYLLEDCAHAIGVLWNGKHTVILKCIALPLPASPHPSFVAPSFLWLAFA